MKSMFKKVIWATALAGLLLGSVTQRLLHIAPCPVLAVPSSNGTGA